jgi:hypothetical protein
MQNQVNDLVSAVRTDYWRKTLDLKEVRSRMTTSKTSEFERQLQERCFMDFTENNIRQFVLNIIGSYEQTLTDAVVEIFDLFTIKHCYSDGLYDENIHYFNGWKTNNAFKVGKKVVIPIYGGHSNGPWLDWSGKWKLQYGAGEKLRDIDVVMNYFDALNDYQSITYSLDYWLDRQVSRNIESTYFKITVYKKGTIHLTFQDENILRRFNVVACRAKNMLPHDYGKKGYGDMDNEEKAVVDSFEGAESYLKNLNRPLFAVNRNFLAIEAA